MVSGIIYKATNKINGMSYIGQTIQTLDKRIMQHIFQEYAEEEEKQQVVSIGSMPIEVIRWIEKK